MRRPREADPDGPVVLCLLAYPRSGTTVLANVLGELDGWSHVGELRDFWTRDVANRSRQLCGCGEPVAHCDHWRAVVKAAFGDLPDGDPTPPEGASVADAMVPSAATVMSEAQRTLANPALVRGPGTAPATIDAAEAFARTQGALYRAMAAVTGSRVVIDSSKSVAEVAAVARHSGLTVRVLEMTRDPRGVLFSRQRRLADRRQDGTVVLSPKLTLTDGLQWVWSDLSNSMLLHRWGVVARRLDYDDLMAEPQSIIRSLVANVGHVPARWPFDGPRTITLGTNHTISGNVNRFWTGSVALLPDELWREMLSTRDRLLLGVAAAPGRLERRLRRRLRR